LKIAILGTRGIPNNYGGFEQFAEYISLGLTMRGHTIYVYSPHNHSYKEQQWKGVNIIHKFDPEYLIGTAGQFVYDLNCILDSRTRKFDLILQLGYTSSTIWSFLFPKNALLVTNMDGLEWKRTKYSESTKKFLKYAERLAVQKSDYLIADSVGIQQYLLTNFKVPSVYLPYGATIFENPDSEFLNKFNLTPYQYDLIIARLEPENSLEVILEGFTKSETKRALIIVGNYQNKYGRYLLNKFGNDQRISFKGPIYDLPIVNNLRYFSNIYFHGHTVGGTNPSLLEAMASNALIVAHKNEFNGSILQEDAKYFSDSDDVQNIVDSLIKSEGGQKSINSNLAKVKDLYSWEKIIGDYQKYFEEILSLQK
jgi:glycosyltransferase involved in cell wall biosynthesis